MNETEQVDEAGEAEGADEPAAPETPREGDEDAYEDSWYQVLRRLSPGAPPGDSA